MVGEGSRERVVLDPIYGYIRIPKSLEAIVDHPLTQRLRRVSQTALAHSVYPSLHGTRFEHALGSMHLARLSWNSAWQNSPEHHLGFMEATKRTVQNHAWEGDGDFARLVGDAIACVGLLHDVGHPPFSHALEHEYELLAPRLFSPESPIRASMESGVPRRPFHERAGSLLVKHLLDIIADDRLRELIQKIYEARPYAGGWDAALRGIVAGEVDVDRMDYLMRDAQAAGTEYGAMDYQRLTEALEIHVHDNEFRIGPGIRARSAAEMLLLQRSQSYKWVYFHPRVVASDLFLALAVRELFSLSEGAEQLWVGGSFLDIRGLLRRIRPQLDYLELRAADSFERVLGLVYVETRPGSMDVATPVDLLDEATQSAVRAQRLDDMRFAVDDYSVTDALRRAYLLTRLLLDSSRDKLADSMPFERFVRFVEIALYRRKLCWPAWKNQEEYAQMAVHLSDPLGEAVEEAVSTVKDQVDRRYHSWLSTYLDRWKERLVNDPVAAFGELSYLVLRKPSTTFTEYMNSRPPKSNGIPFVRDAWYVAWRDFAPLKADRQASLLYRNREAPVLLRETSPLVGALELAEAQRMKVFIYWVQESAGAPGSHSRQEVRRRLREELVEHYPGFVKGGLPSMVKELLLHGTG